MSAIRLQVISFQGVFLDALVDFFKFQGPLGETGVLKGHAPLLTKVQPGWFSYQVHNIESQFYTQGGLIEVRDNVATFLAEQCSLEKIDFFYQGLLEQKKKSDESKRSQRSFHQLYAELARGPVDLDSIKGIGMIKKTRA